MSHAYKLLDDQEKSDEDPVFYQNGKYLKL